MSIIEYIKYEIGKSYVENPLISENSEHVKFAFKEISKVNKELFNRIPYDVIFTDDDPYQSAKEMREQVQETGEIRIYTEWSGHPFLTKEENAIGRAVHDVWAHLVCGCPFTFQGEYTGYLEQRNYYPRWTWRVLFAEIPAQTCAYYYKRSFDYKQRAIEAPHWWMTLCKGIELDYRHNSILGGFATPRYARSSRVLSPPTLEVLS